MLRTRKFAVQHAYARKLKALLVAPLLIGGLVTQSVTASAAVSMTDYPIVPLCCTEYPPVGIASGPDGSLWFTYQFHNAVGKMTVAGSATAFASPEQSNATLDAGGIVAGADGNMWITEGATWGSTRRVAKITPSGQFTEFSGTESIVSRGITAGPDGNIWFTESQRTGNGGSLGTIARIATITTDGTITEYPITASSAPYGIATGSDGNLWFTEVSGKAVGKMTGSGAFTEYALPSGNSAWEITAGPDGNLWFTEDGTAGGKIGRITTGGVISEFSASADYPTGITTGPDGNLWYLDPRTWVTGSDTDYIASLSPSDPSSISKYAIPRSQPQAWGVSGAPDGAHIHAITTGADGALWFTEAQRSGRIGRLTGFTALPTTQTALAQSSDTSGLGDPVTLTATISSAGSPVTVGSVQFEDNGAFLGAAVAVDGAGNAAMSAPLTTAGVRNLTAVYHDYTGTVQTSTSEVTVHTVNRASTTTTLMSSAAGTLFGENISFTASVTATQGGTPSGSVTFKDGETSIGTATVDGAGQALLSTAALAVGSHTATAVYDGDTNHSGSTASAIVQTVNKASTITAVTSSVNPASYGLSTTITATTTAVAPGAGTPTGNVTFTEGTNTLATDTLSGGSGAFVYTCPDISSHTITVTYAGDISFLGSTSTPLTQNCSAATETALTVPSSQQITTNSHATLTVALTPNPGTVGLVTLFEGDRAIGDTATPNSSGVATLDTGTLPVGVHTIYAIYSGGGNYAGSTSNNVTVTVVSETTTVVVPGQQTVTFGSETTEHVVVGEPCVSTGNGVMCTEPVGGLNGTVTLYDGTQQLGSAEMVNGTSVDFPVWLNVGIHDQIHAVYSGGNDFMGATAGSTSANVTVTVVSGTTTVVLPAPQTVTYGSEMRLYVAVGEPCISTGNGVMCTEPVGGLSGTVTLYDGAQQIGSTPLVNGTSVDFPVSLSVGTHDRIHAVYSGGSDFKGATGGSTSANITVTVVSGTTTVVWPGSQTVTDGGDVTEHVSVGEPCISTSNGVMCSEPIGGLTGTVTLYDGSQQIGSATLIDGTSVDFPVMLSVGVHDQVHAVYSGGSDFMGATAGSTSGNVTVTVTAASGKAATTTILSTSSNPSKVHTPVTLTATVRASGGVVQPTGSVAFYSGATLIKTVSIDDDGSAAVTTATLDSGTQTISAVYSGDDNSMPSTSSSLQQTVDEDAVLSPAIPIRPTTISLAASDHLSPADGGKVVAIVMAFSAATFLAVISGAGVVGFIMWLPLFVRFLILFIGIAIPVVLWIVSKKQRQQKQGERGSSRAPYPLWRLPNHLCELPWFSGSPRAP